MATAFPTTPTFLTTDPSFNDYRPTMGPAGEHGDLRTHAGARRRQPDDAADDRRRQQSQPVAVPVGLAAGLTDPARLVLGETKATSCSTAPSSNSEVPRQRLAGRQTTARTPTLISGTTGAYYPKWALGAPGSSPRTPVPRRPSPPLQSDLHPRRRRADRNVDGKIDLSNTCRLFGGMPAVMSSDLPQDRLCRPADARNWNGPNSPATIQRELQLHLPQRWTQTAFSVSSPLELDALVSSFDPHFEGRAPDMFHRRHDDRLSSSIARTGGQLLDLPVQPKNNSVTQVTDARL